MSSLSLNSELCTILFIKLPSNLLMIFGAMHYLKATKNIHIIYERQNISPYKHNTSNAHLSQSLRTITVSYIQHAHTFISFHIPHYKTLFMTPILLYKFNVHVNPITSHILSKLFMRPQTLTYNSYIHITSKDNFTHVNTRPSSYSHLD